MSAVGVPEAALRGVGPAPGGEGMLRHSGRDRSARVGVRRGSGAPGSAPARSGREQPGAMERAVSVGGCSSTPVPVRGLSGGCDVSGRARPGDSARGHGASYL